MTPEQIVNIASRVRGASSYPARYAKALEMLRAAIDVALKGWEKKVATYEAEQRRGREEAKDLRVASEMRMREMGLIQPPVKSVSVYDRLRVPLYEKPKRIERPLNVLPGEMEE